MQYMSVLYSFKVLTVLRPLNCLENFKELKTFSRLIHLLLLIRQTSDIQPKKRECLIFFIDYYHLNLQLKLVAVPESQLQELENQLKSNVTYLPEILLHKELVKLIDLVKDISITRLVSVGRSIRGLNKS